MVPAMQMVAAVAGGLLLLTALVDFFRSLWRSPPKRGEAPDGMPGGVQGSNGYDSGGHADGGGGHAGH